MIKHLTLAAILATTAQFANADELTFTLASKHLTESGYLKPHHSYTEINPGIGYYFSKPNIGFGVYRNSYGGDAFYIGRHWDTKHVKVTYGMLRYSNFKWKDDVNYSPFFQLSRDIKNFRIGYSPMVRKNSRGKWIYGVFTLQYIVPID